MQYQGSFYVWMVDAGDITLKASGFSRGVTTFGWDLALNPSKRRCTIEICMQVNDGK
jgi:hypothetical protein